MLENYSDRAVSVRVLDRIPVQTETISVRLGKISDSLTEDVEHERSLRPKGILRWDVKVPAKAARGTAKTVSYAFTLEYDADLLFRRKFTRCRSTDLPDQLVRLVLTTKTLGLPR